MIRLEYLLAFRHVELPTPLCRKVLLAISAGDTRRQRELDAGQHLLGCETCAALSEPLGRRSIALTAITFPAALAAGGLAKVRAHPVHSAVSATVGSAAVAVAVVLVTRPGPPPVKPAVPAISQLTIGGHQVPDAQARHSIRSMIGDPADAAGVNVDAVVSRNGFWIGAAEGRIWVELVGPLKPLHIQAGLGLHFRDDALDVDIAIPETLPDWPDALTREQIMRCNGHISRSVLGTGEKITIELPRHLEAVAL